MATMLSAVLLLAAGLAVPQNSVQYAQAQACSSSGAAPTGIESFSFAFKHDDIELCYSSTESDDADQTTLNEEESAEETEDAEFE